MTLIIELPVLVAPDLAKFIAPLKSQCEVLAFPLSGQLERYRLRSFQIPFRPDQCELRDGRRGVFGDGLPSSRRMLRKIVEVVSFDFAPSIVNGHGPGDLAPSPHLGDDLLGEVWPSSQSPSAFLTQYGNVFPGPSLKIARLPPDVILRENIPLGHVLDDLRIAFAGKSTASNRFNNSGSPYHRIPGLLAKPSFKGQIKMDSFYRELSDWTGRASPRRGAERHGGA